MKAEEFPQEARRLRPVLVAIALDILGDRDEAEDIVQDVLLKLWSLCPQLRMPVDTLASVVTRNMARSCLRRRRPVSDIAAMEISCDDASSECEQRLDCIMKCIDALPTFQQLVVRLRHIDGMDYSSIARVTGSSEAAVRKAISRARQTIRHRYWEEDKK